MNRHAVEISSFNPPLAEWLVQQKPSAMQNMLRMSMQPGVTSFSLGFPDISLFPMELYNKAIQKNFCPDHLQYRLPVEQLKTQILRILKLRGVLCDESQIFLTSGAQQGISLLLKLLLNSRDEITLEHFVYPGFMQAIASYFPKVCPVKSDGFSGVNLESLQTCLNNNTPKLFYTVSDGHNPLGVSLSSQEKQNLVSLTVEHEVPIVEDDPYGLIQYDGTSVALRSFDSQYTFYVGSFSKIFGPSFRVGWIVAPKQYIEKLSIIRESSDLNVGTFSQHVLAQILDELSIEEHVFTLSQAYREKRNIIVEAIQEFFPKNCKYRVPSSGFFLWVELPEDINTRELLEISIATAKIAFIPGDAFGLEGVSVPKNCLRLNFSFLPKKELYRGIKSLGKILQNWNTLGKRVA